MSNVFNPANVEQKNSTSVEVNERQPIVKKTSFESQIEKFRQSGTEEQKRLVRALDSFVETTFPFEKDGYTLRKITDDAGVTAQHQLFQALYHVIERSPEEEFKKLWNIALAYFANYKETVFNGKWVYRWAYAWSWGEEKLDLLQRLVNLMMLTCDPNTRRNELRKVDLVRTVEIVLSEEGKNRLIAFYSS